MVGIVAQIIGIIAMIFNILSFQCKKNRNLTIVLGIGSLLFSANFILLNAFASAGFNIINIFRSITFINKKTRNNLFFAINILLYFIVALFTYESLWTLVLLFAQFAGTYAIWYKDGGFIRKAQCLCVSPIWLVNNTFVTFTIGGIICETFTIVSALVSFIRFRKSGFDKSQ